MNSVWDIWDSETLKEHLCKYAPNACTVEPVYLLPYPCFFFLLSSLSCKGVE